ncbi:MAG: carboxypeptidase regulatory-like domain-containing protein [Acidobacteria bacterium]|nr:MAG: carboxypeptidase regulatory-like domain-containing protein [Acidobacteriota bacterium]
MALLASVASGQGEVEAVRNSLEASSLPQSWQGSSGVRIVVTDETGAPLPDVDVLMRLERDSASATGVLLLRTGQDGSTRVEGLAAGEWQVDLRREGYMLLTAYIALEADGDPKVGFSTRQRTGTFWAELDAVFLPPDLEIKAALRTGRDSPKQARKARAKALEREREAAERRDRRQRRGDLAKVVEEPEADRRAAERAAERRAERERREAEKAAAAAARAGEIAARQAERDEEERRRGRMATVVEAPEPGRPGAEPEPEVAADAPATADSTQVAAAEPVEEPPTEAALAPDDISLETPSAAAAEAPGAEPMRLLPNPRLLPAGACPECRPGEFSVSTETIVPALEAGSVSECSRGLAAPLAGLAPVLGEALAGVGARFAGSLVEARGDDVRRLLPTDLASRIDAIVDSVGAADGSCAVLGIVLPAAAQYVGFRYQAGERGTYLECGLGQDCQIQQARFVETPVVTPTGTVTVVHAVFENRAPRQRSARLIVYFRPAPGWLPPN